MNRGWTDQTGILWIRISSHPYGQVKPAVLANGKPHKQNTMAEMNFGGVMETVVTSHEFSLEKAREVLKNETIAAIGYGIQGPGQACNLRDNGFNVIVGQRQVKTYEKCLKDGSW